MRCCNLSFCCILPAMDSTTLYALLGIIGVALLSILSQVFASRRRRRLADIMALRPKIIDVRTAKEYRTDHIAGAVNIPVQKLYMDPLKAGSKEKPIVLYCQSGGRARRAKRILKAYGYTQVVNGGGLSKLKPYTG